MALALSASLTGVPSSSIPKLASIAFQFDLRQIMASVHFRKFCPIRCSSNPIEKSFRTCDTCKGQFDPSSNNHRDSRYHTAHFGDKVRSMSRIVLPTTQEVPSTRRNLVVRAGVSLLAILTLNCSLTPLPVWAEDNSNEQKEENDGVIGAIQSLFDPDEKTKSGKVLPKAYLKSVREVVKTLRESLAEDPKDNAKFRRTADAAKGAIRDYLSNWRGQQKVASEESYAVLEKTIRSLAGFYSKAGPSARIPEEVKSEILNDLTKAEEFL